MKSADSLIQTRFPTEVFPEALQNYIAELSNKKNIPTDYSSVAVLSAFSTAIGKKAVLNHDNYLNYCGIWVGLVGASGTNKSEPISIALKPLRIRDEEKFTNYLIERELTVEYLSLSKKERELREKRLPPVLGADIVDDITIETLYDALFENPKGILSANDELMSWIEDLSGYSGRSSQSKFLSFWSNETTTYFRKEQKLFIKKPFVNIIGGIQPALLQELAKKNRNSDGTINRFLFAYPDNVKAELASGEKISEYLQTRYLDAVNKLSDFPWNTSTDFGVNEATELSIAEGFAQILFEEKISLMNDKLNSLSEIHPHRAFLAKLKIYLYRLTLLLHEIEFAYSGSQTIKSEIRDETVRKAALLIDYFENTALKVQSKLSEPQTIISEKQLLVELRDRTRRPYGEILEFVGSNVKESTLRQWCARQKTQKQRRVTCNEKTVLKHCISNS